MQELARIIREIVYTPPTYKEIPGFLDAQRQALILQYFAEDPGLVLTVKEVQSRFSVVSMTARKDLSELVQHGYLQEIAINKVTRGYLRGQKIDELRSLK